MSGSFVTKEAALAYIQRHDADVKTWDRRGKATLANLVRERARQSGAGNWVVGGPQEWGKDELINWLADSYYPHINEAREVAYQ